MSFEDRKKITTSRGLWKILKALMIS
jgi:hypothetical protein